jgi:tetratricopeptide (TPR) repeat protein
MGRALVENILSSVDLLSWPETPEATELGRSVYEVGLDKADEFQRNSKVLVEALRTFRSGQSRPYAFAGLAYILVKASREKDGSYYRGGLDAALEWLEKAQESAPDVVEINMIEALIYIYSGRFDDARLILDYLQSIDPVHYHLHTAEVAYWQEQKKLGETIEWYKKAMQMANSVPRKLRLLSRQGDVYLSQRKYREAIEVFREAAHFSTENPWLWHNMSLAYWRLEEFKEAARCNKRALSLQRDLPEALKMADALKDKLDSGGLSQRLFGRR